MIENPRDDVLAALESQLERILNLPELADPFTYVAGANYCVPMALDLSIRFGNHIVDNVPRYSSMDHSVNWQTLVGTLRRFGDSFMEPYFDRVTLPDPFVEEMLSLERNRHRLRQAVASIRDNVWTVEWEDQEAGILRVSLSNPARRSALYLVANRASLASETPEAAAEIMRWSRDGGQPDTAALARAMGVHQLRVFTEAAPSAWAQLETMIGLESSALPLIRSMLIRLIHGGQLWFGSEQLWLMWNEWLVGHVAPSIDRSSFETLLMLHSVTVDEAESWNVQAPLVAFDETYALWPFAYHVLPPDLSFLSLLIRRHSDEWSRTLGTNLAHAADWLGAQLPHQDRLVWAPRRKHGNLEADLAIGDPETGTVVVLELKTTFDKFRTNLALSNFVDQRVNYTKAFQQAEDAAEAVRSGAWRPQSLFPSGPVFEVRAVYEGVLTWYDTFNPRQGAANSGMSCNYATFVYVLLRSGGDLAATVLTIQELSGIYCGGVLLK